MNATRIAAKPDVSGGVKSSACISYVASQLEIMARARIAGIPSLILMRSVGATWIGKLRPVPSMVLLSGGFMLGSCGDPVRDKAMAELGPEDPRVAPGPEHRPGQPCVLCHSDAGGASAFSLAGTVYLNRDSNMLIAGVDVLIFDSNQATFKSTTNCAGNFFIRPEDFVPQYPIWLSLRAGDVVRDMDSAAYREGSCGACHQDPISAHSPGHVYLVEDAMLETPPPSRCP